MCPKFELGPCHISTYGAMYALAVVVFGLGAFHRLLRDGRPPRAASRALLLVIAGTVAGTYLPCAIPAASALVQTGRLELHGQTSLLWGLAVGIALAIWRSRELQTSPARTLDLGILPLPLALAIVRLGCFAAGCCYGRPANSWLSAYLPDVYGVWLQRYPTQLLSIAADLLTFVALVSAERWLRSHRKAAWAFDGVLALLFVAVFSLKRFVVQFLRADYAPVWGPFSWVHLATGTSFVAAALLIAWNLCTQARHAQRTARTEGG